MFKLEDCFAFIARNSSKIFANELESRLKKHNTTLSQWFVLYYVNQYEGLTQRELANHMSITEPSTGRLVGDMEYDGYLDRKQEDHDLRIKTLTLTEKGKKLYKKLEPIVVKFKDDTVAGIDENELSVIRSVLDQMVANVLKE